MLKDKDKTLARILEAEKELSIKLRETHARLSSEAGELSRRLDGVTAFKQEREIRRRVRDIEECIKELKEALGKGEDKLRKIKAEIRECEKEIAATLGEYGVNVRW